MSFFDQFTKKGAAAPAKTAAKSGKAVAKTVPKKKATATVVVKKGAAAAPSKATKGWLGGEGGSSTNLDKWYGEC